MPAVWTAPATWSVDQLVTNDDMNEQVRDNLLYLLEPNFEELQADNSGTFSITNVTTFQDVDANFDVDIDTHGGQVLVVVNFSATNGGTAVYFDLAVNGTRVSPGTLGMYVLDVQSGDIVPVCLTYIVDGLAPGTHNISLQWRTASTNTATILANVTTVMPNISAVEI
jgi:hypothetical protein